MKVRNYIEQQRAVGKKMLAVLIDPDKHVAEQVLKALESNADGIDFIFVGGSSGGEQTEKWVKQLKSKLSIPVVLFPGNIAQFTPQADALLFLSLLSGRNPDMLIGNQVQAAKQVAASGIETIAMGYILVDGGKRSAVEKASHTQAIPANNEQQIVSTAIAAELLGMHTVYLEAGSGAAQPIATNTIRQVRQNIHLPLIIGGGICTIEAMHKAFEAGADIVVIGNHFEQHPEEIQLFAQNK